MGKKAEFFTDIFQNRFGIISAPLFIVVKGILVQNIFKHGKIWKYTNSHDTVIKKTGSDVKIKSVFPYPLLISNLGAHKNYLLYHLTFTSRIEVMTPGLT